MVSALSAASAVAQEKVTYQDHVTPILQNHCLGCHNADKKRGDLDLSTYATSMAGGAGGSVVASGDAASSRLFKVVSHLEEPYMPPKKPKISDPEIAVLKKWIEGGLLETSGSIAKKSSKPRIDLALPASSGKPAGTPAMPEDLAFEPPVRTARAEAANAIASSPWAPVVAVGGQHQVVLYHADTLDFLGILAFPERRPHVLKFSRNGALLLAGGGQGAKLGRVVVWDVKTGDRVLEIGQEYDAVLAADISSDHSRVALGGPGRLVKIFSTRDGQMEHSIKQHTDWVTALEFSPDGVLLASGDRNGGVHVWEVGTGRIFHTLRGHRAGITDLSWRADSNVLATAGEDGQVRLWEMQEGKGIGAFAAHPAVLSVEFARGGQIVTSGRDGLVRTWDGNGTRQREFEPMGDLALSAVFTHDDKRVVAGAWTGEVRAWDAADGKRAGTLSNNPPKLAERLVSDVKRLEEARAEHAKRIAEEKSAAEAAAKGVAELAAMTKSAADAEAAVKASEARLAETAAAEAAAGKGAAEADAALKARQAEAAAKGEVSKQAAAAVGAAADEVKKLQDTASQALKDLQEPGGDAAAEARKLEGAQKAASEKAADLVRLAEASAKSKAEASMAESTVGPATKLLGERQAAQKAAESAKAEGAAKLAQAKAAHAEIAKALPEKQRLVKLSEVVAGQSKEAVTAAAARIVSLERDLALWKAAQFNLGVHAARAELAKVMGEHGGLLGATEQAKESADAATAAAKAGEKAAADAAVKVKACEEALVVARGEPQRTAAAVEAAMKSLVERQSRAKEAAAFAAKLAEAAKAAPGDANLTGAAAKAQESVGFLDKDVEAGRQAVAAREADEKNAPQVIAAAEKSLADAKAAADAASKKVPGLQEAAKQAAEKAAAALVAAEQFKPRLDAAKAKVESLRAEYILLKPKPQAVQR